MIPVSPGQLGPLYTAVIRYNPLLMKITFLIAIYLIYLNIPNLKKELRGVKPITWLMLILILLSAFTLTEKYSEPATITGKMWLHADVADEIDNPEEYMNRNLHRPEFYPLTLATAFKILGKSPETVEMLGSLFTTLTGIGIFVITYLITGRDIASLASTMIYPVLPLTLQHATRGTALPLYVFLSCFTFGAFLLSLRTRKRKAVLLTGTLFILSMATRMETVLLIPLLMGGYLALFNKDEFQKMIIPGAILLLVGLQMLPFLAQSQSSFGYNMQDPTTQEFNRRYPEASTSTFSISHLQRNMPHIVLELKRNHLFHFFNPVIITLFLTGTIRSAEKSHQAFPILWSASIILFFGLWFAGSIISLGLHLLQLMAPTAIILGIGADTLFQKLNKITSWPGPVRDRNIRTLAGILFTLILVIPSVLSTTYLYQKEASLYQQIQKEEKKLPENHCLITENNSLGPSVNSLDVVDFASDKEVRESYAGCSNENIYYINFTEKAHPRKMQENFHSKLEKIDEKCELEKEVEREKFSIIKLVCKLEQ